MATSTQERLFCAIEVPLIDLEGKEPGSMSALLASRSSIGRASGWVPLLHITLYFFQHDSRSADSPVWTREYITQRLQAPEFEAKSFDLKISKVVFCGTRTLRLNVVDDSNGLQELHHKIVDALNLPPLPGGWEKGHISLYRFNNTETKKLTADAQDPSVSWTNDLVSQYQDMKYTFNVNNFKLYLSEPSGYTPVATFQLK